MTDFSRRAFLQALGVGVAGTVVAAKATTPTPTPSPTPTPTPTPVEGQVLFASNAKGIRRPIRYDSFTVEERCEMVSDGSFGGWPADDFSRVMPGRTWHEVDLITLDELCFDDVLLVVPFDDVEYRVPVNIGHVTFVTDEVRYHVHGRSQGRVERVS